LLGKESGSASLNRRDGLEPDDLNPGVQRFIKVGVAKRKRL
jgi:hypothetical protein